jgi:Nucleoside H+ symporter
MPWIYRRFSLKAILLIGLFAWSVRYMLLGYGNADAGMWMFYIAILLHGVCFDFFFMTGQLYTDQEAPPNLRGTAQGLLAFLTYGVGMFIGAELSGVAVDFFTTKTGSVVTRNWTGFWVSSAASAFVVALFVAFFFNSRGKVQNKSESTIAEHAI